MWSVGATGYTDGRMKFDEWLRAKMKEAGSTCMFPEEGIVYDYSINDDGERDDRIVDEDAEDGDEEEEFSLGWKPWAERIEAPVFPDNAKFFEMVVPTVDSVRTQYVVEKLLKNKKQVLVVGPTGSGKSLTVGTKLLAGMPERFVSNFLSFSAKTNANQTQDMMDMKT